MKILVTGSSGHLGEALVHTLRSLGHEPVGVDLMPSPTTEFVGNITDRGFISQCIAGCSTVLHTATLHKPHIGTHSRQDFINTNISGTLVLLEEALAHKCESFIFTSTTSTYGDAMRHNPGDPAVWVTETLVPIPKNIYGVTKSSAESLCELFHRKTQMPCLVLKTSRFFAEEDDSPSHREDYDDTNLKVNELLFRRADIADIVKAHTLAISRAPQIGFDRFIISSTPPFNKDDAKHLGINAPEVVKKYIPNYEQEYIKRNWKMFPTLGRVYDNTHARTELGWEPDYTFARAIELLGNNNDYRSSLARQIGKKKYHERDFDDGPYPVTRF